MRRFSVLILNLLMAGVLVSCGNPEDDGKLPGSSSGGSNYNGLIPSRPWDPGTKQNGSGYGYGYGYGSGGNYPEEVQVNCLVEPCVFGSCVVGSANSTHCECDLGYAGRLCQECDDGYSMQGGLCIQDDGCVRAHCVYGKCKMEDGEATCQCYLGYTGDKCDMCDNGYHLDEGSRTCVAD